MKLLNFEKPHLAPWIIISDFIWNIIYGNKARRIIQRWKWCWWHFDVGNLKLITISGCWWLNFNVGDILCKNIVDVGDQKDQTRHQHLKVVTNTSRLQHPSPTSMKPIEITLRMLVSLKILPNKNMVWWENTIYFIINMNWWIQIFQNEIFNFTFSRAGLFPPRTNWPKLPVSTHRESRRLHWCWWQVDVGKFMLVTVFGCCLWN